MKWILWLVPVLAIGAGFLYLQQLRSAPPEVGFVKVRQEPLVSAVSTNGKVEPLEYAGVRSERDGAVLRVHVEKGQVVAKGAVVAELDATVAKADLASAETRIAQARAELESLRQGGRTRDVADINASIDRARLDLANARGQVESLTRLVEKKAATGYELEQARQRVAAAEAEIRGLEQRRGSLVSAVDRTSVESRIRELEISASLARQQIAQAVVRSPIAGTVYQLDIRPGAYLRPGDLVGYVGLLDRVRVVLYVDEPELGNVQVGQEVTVTWDALPGRKWSGTVEKLPTQITTLGSRQVGEVLSVIENEQRSLIPNTNVNAEIRTRSISSAMTIPKEALRRVEGKTGVFVLQADETVRWQPVELGAASVTRLQVTSGLSTGTAVALPTDVVLTQGMKVKPSLQP
ncbi:MAG: efflux RND transporter periplasmic adaptor subunit [Bryobacterales bacterium]|nr:efflux RND transporter periplasmic adaptor subunit [Bryobacterales bacterium]